MYSVLSLISKHIVDNRHFASPLLLSLLASLSQIYTPVKHSLLVTATSWLSLALLTLLRAGVSLGPSDRQRRLVYLAGASMSLSYICDRAACDKAGIWTTKPLLPLLVVFFSRDPLFCDLLASNPQAASRKNTAAETSAPNETRSPVVSYYLVAAMTLSSSVVLAIYVDSPTFILGLSSVIFASCGLILFEAVLNKTWRQTTHDAANDLPATRTSSPFTPAITIDMDEQILALRDFASVIGAVCGLASCFMEPSVFVRTISWDSPHPNLDGERITAHSTLDLGQILWMSPVNGIVNILTFMMLSRAGSTHTSLVVLFACMCAKLLITPSFFHFGFAFVYSASASLHLFGPFSPAPLIDLRNAPRLRRIILGFATLFLGFFLIQYAAGMHGSSSINSPSTVPAASSPALLDPIWMDLRRGHPAAQLIHAAETDFQITLNRQSNSLAAAVREYRRRNGIAPPPYFDKWYEFAARNKVVLIDEFDTINDMLLPFWALKPVTIRSRVADALGHEDVALIGVAIRDGAVVLVENGESWQQQATVGMLKTFVQYLPDMDLAFNIHDEPRVIVPNNLLSEMVITAQNKISSCAAANRAPRNSFPRRPSDLGDGKRFAESSTTRFNRFAHQQTWTHSRLSCPANTQAQVFEDHAADNLTAFAASPLGYVYNVTAFSDICNSPSLASTFGFFERPNTFNVVQELTPVFSASKISSFQDLLYPSPWYWSGKVGYDESHDTGWENKTNSFYWRGSTTGGYSRNGGWRRQHRQHVVRRVNAPDTAKVLAPIVDSTVETMSEAWTIREIERRSRKHLIDVKFSHVGQCDPSDCDAQKEFFDITDHVDGQNAWYHKHLLDMDGNAFSGRFYSFLKSRSLTYKMAIFREWHAEWLRPWVHYIPLGLKGDEYLDLIRWFSGDRISADTESRSQTSEGADTKGNGDSLGERKAREIAERSTEWHNKALRNVDLEVWLFRLLLEYGRVIDDAREEIGYPGP